MQFQQRLGGRCPDQERLRLEELVAIIGVRLQGSHVRDDEKRQQGRAGGDGGQTRLASGRIRHDNTLDAADPRNIYERRAVLSLRAPDLIVHVGVVTRRHFDDGACF